MKNLYENFLSEPVVPIDVKLSLINEIAFINLIKVLGYKSEWYGNKKEDVEELSKIRELSEEHTKHLLKLFNSTQEEE